MSYSFTSQFLRGSLSLTPDFLQYLTFFAYFSSQIKERPVPDLISAMVTVKRNFGVDHRRPSKELSKKICVGSGEKQLIKVYLDTRKNTPAC